MLHISKIKENEKFLFLSEMLTLEINWMQKDVQIRLKQLKKIKENIFCRSTAAQSSIAYDRNRIIYHKFVLQNGSSFRKIA